MASDVETTEPAGMSRDASAEEGATGDELERIREIIVGGASRRVDERHAALETRLTAALAELATRLDGEIATLRRANATKVDREQLAALFGDIGRQLASPSPVAAVPDKAA